jgi:hypothetical protein
MDEAGAPPAPTGLVSDTRAASVRRALDVWQRQLVDLSGRNRLLYYRDQLLGTIDLGAANAPADPVAVDQLLAGSTVTLARLFADPATDAAAREAAVARQAKRARTVAAKASEMFEERGIRTLFLAVGMAHWTETQSAAQPSAPVVLFPLEALGSAPYADMGRVHHPDRRRGRRRSDCPELNRPEREGNRHHDRLIARTVSRCR